MDWIGGGNMQQGFSPEGYIIDQNCFGAYRYRTIPSSINGCGWIAAFDFLHALAIPVTWRQVLSEMDAMYPVKEPGPTPEEFLYQYLLRYTSFTVSYGKKAVLRASYTAQAGILRYWEEGEPHFVPFVRQEQKLFRFFNVIDGMEDCTFTMSEFIKQRCVVPVLRAVTAGSKELIVR